MKNTKTTTTTGGDLVVHADQTTFAILRPDDSTIRRVLVRNPDGIPVADLLDRLDDAVTVFRPTRILVSLGEAHRTPDAALAANLHAVLNRIEEREHCTLHQIPDVRSLAWALRPRPRIPPLSACPPSKPPSPQHPIEPLPDPIRAPNFLCPRYGFPRFAPT